MATCELFEEWTSLKTRLEMDNLAAFLQPTVNTSFQRSCAHHAHSSTKKFITSIQSHLERFIPVDAGIQACKEVIHDKDRSESCNIVYSELANGFCQSCAIYVTSRLATLIRANQKKLPERPDLGFGMHSLALNTVIGYITNCLVYCETAQFLFENKTLFVECLDIINYSITLLQTSIKHNKPLRKAYSMLSHLWNQMIVNVHLMRKKHWKIILSNESEYFRRWVMFYYDQRKYELNEEAKDCLERCKILLCIGSVYMKPERFMLEWMDPNVAPYLNTSQMFITGLAMLSEKTDCVDPTVFMIQLSGRKIWHTKRMSIKCGYDKCRNTRKCVDKFYKCKACQVVRYCSRRCQKKDWHRGNHAECCMKFRKLRASSKMLL